MPPESSREDLQCLHHRKSGAVLDNSRRQRSERHPKYQFFRPKFLSDLQETCSFLLGVMFGFAAPRIFRQVPASTSPVHTSAIIHLKSGGRLYLDESNISPPRLEFLKAQHRKCIEAVPLAAYDLPLDLRTFLFEYDPNRVPECLYEFLDVTGRFVEQILGVEERVRRRCEGEEKQRFLDTVVAVIQPLRKMEDLLESLEHRRPEELRGNIDRIQEWREDLDLMQKGLTTVLVNTARCLEKSGQEEAVKEVRGLRDLRLLRCAFEEKARDGAMDKISRSRRSVEAKCSFPP